MFKDYQSKPITRKAHQVESLDELSAVDESTATLTIGMEQYTYKYYEPVKVGDFIVFLDDTDIYHCSEKVFKERNIV